MMQNKKLNQITAWVAILATVIVMLISSIYLIEHANHQCSGNECPICSVMNQCSNNLKLVGAAIIIAAASLLHFTFLLKKSSPDTMIACSNSLVFQKVRMNN